MIGHVAFSPVDWAGGGDWAGLGPVSVDPAHQRRGIGARLIEAGLANLRSEGADGCMVLGDPAYYGRFGFRADPRWSYPGPPPEYFMALPFTAVAGEGAVRYHSAFG